MKLAQFYKIKNKQVLCQLCNHYCLIAENKTGLCGVRKNIKDKLYSLVYGKVVVANIDPIEKKPLFHFMPGSLSYSIATVGCNFRCKNCQNADISQFPITQATQNLIPGEGMTAVEVVKNAQKAGCQSIAYTYTEPTIYAEFALDCMQLAHKAGLKNVWVSNGYTAKEAWPKIIPYLDAINIDLKFFNNESYLNVCGAKLQPVLDNLIYLKKKKVWLEVTTLVIPGLNDSDQELNQIAEFLANELGTDTPWHVSRFFPHYEMQSQLATKEDLVYNAFKIGKDAGLKYVYGGNVLDETLENTYCPDCGQLIIKRIGYQIKLYDKAKHCPKCDYLLNFY